VVEEVEKRARKRHQLLDDALARIRLTSCTFRTFSISLNQSTDMFFCASGESSDHPERAASSKTLRLEQADKEREACRSNGNVWTGVSKYRSIESPMSCSFHHQSTSIDIDFSGEGLIKPGCRVK